MIITILGWCTWPGPQKWLFREFMVARGLRAVISSADFRVGHGILKVPYGELFFVAPSGSDLGARAGS